MLRMIAVAVVALSAGQGLAQSSSPYLFTGGYPSAEASTRARDDADFQRARVAYRFWYPTVSMEGIFQGNRNVGIEDGKAWGIAVTGPRQVGLTLNSDTPMDRPPSICPTVPWSSNYRRGPSSVW